MSDPWVALMTVIVLAVVAFVVLRRLGGETRLRTATMHSLAILADSQNAHHRRYGTWAAHIGRRPGRDTIALVADSGAVIGIARADSLGWEGIGTHPGVTSGARTCFIFGGMPGDTRLTRPDEPKCFR